MADKVLSDFQSRELISSRFREAADKIRQDLGLPIEKRVDVYTELHRHLKDKAVKALLKGTGVFTIPSDLKNPVT